MTEKFDFEQALEALKGGKPLTGQDSVLLPLIKQLAEAALDDLEEHWGQKISDYDQVLAQQVGKRAQCGK